MNDPGTVLTIDGVCAGYGAVEVLHGVSLAVERGEVVALIGPNGAGKTTCLRVAAGILRPRSGAVRVDGRDLASMPAREAALKVSGVPQVEASEFGFTVRETAALGRYARLPRFAPEGEADRAAVADALATVGLADLGSRRLTTLSGGERRRASLARCLAQDADVLLLDEPTAHLDLGHEVRLLETLTGLAKRRGKAVVAALHDVNLAAMFADRVVLLVAGRVAAQGTPREVLTAERIASAFAARVVVASHPERGVPVVIPLGPAS
jgi:iron complex transport system ATP-binding protein